MCSPVEISSRCPKLPASGKWEVIIMWPPCGCRALVAHQCATSAHAGLSQTNNTSNAENDYRMSAKSNSNLNIFQTSEKFKLCLTVHRRAVQCQTVTADCLLSAVSDWGTLVVAKMSPWLQLDSSVEAVRRNSEEVSVLCTVMTAVGETHMHSPMCLLCRLSLSLGVFLASGTYLHDLYSFSSNMCNMMSVTVDTDMRHA